MKRLLYLLVFLCLSFNSNTQCVKDTFHITKINCYDSVGVIVPIYSLPAIENQGFTFTIFYLFCGLFIPHFQKSNFRKCCSMKVVQTKFLCF